ncbi:MAG: hypothetical protein ACXU9U_05490 [Parachlamydiaceae bacterium]
MRKLIIIQFLFAAFPAFGSVTLSRDYLFPPTMLALVESKIQKAAARDPEMQAYPIFYSIDQTNGISLWCPPHAPKADGTGCSMNFLIKLDSISMTIKKGLALSFNAQQVLEHLKAIDPNSTQDHQFFGSPFEKADTYGSHYYCRPETVESIKSWQCYLFVSETFGGSIM